MIFVKPHYLALVILPLFSPNLFSQQTVLAVIDFEGKGVSEIEASALTDRLRTEISNIGTVKLVERGEMEEILKEQAFQQTGCVSSECMVEVGQLLGVNQIVGGSISQVGRTFSVNARIIDVETGEIISSVNYDYTGVVDELLISGMRNVSQLLFLEEGEGIVELDKEVEYYENGKIKGEGRSILGRKHGRWVYYYDNGRIMRVGNYKGGRVVGKWTYYDEKGQIRLIVEPTRKKSFLFERVTWIEYYEDGNRKVEFRLSRRGMVVSKRIVYHPNGKVLSEEHFFTGTGKYFDCYDSGQKKVVGSTMYYHLDLETGIRTISKRIGVWTFWNEDGTIKEVNDYGEWHLSACYNASLCLMIVVLVYLKMLKHVAV